MDLRAGGKYRLGKKIGSGSFGAWQHVFFSFLAHPLIQLSLGDIYLGVNIISGEESRHQA